jgi:hypothetical protein
MKSSGGTRDVSMTLETASIVRMVIEFLQRTAYMIVKNAEPAREGVVIAMIFKV